MFTSGRCRCRRRGLRAESVGQRARRAPRSHGLAHGVSRTAGRLGGRAGVAGRAAGRAAGGTGQGHPVRAERAGPASGVSAGPGARPGRRDPARGVPGSAVSGPGRRRAPSQRRSPRPHLAAARWAPGRVGRGAALVSRCGELAAGRSHFNTGRDSVLESRGTRSRATPRGSAEDGERRARWGGEGAAGEAPTAGGGRGVRSEGSVAPGAAGWAFPPVGFCVSLAGNEITRHVVFKELFGLKRLCKTFFFLRNKKGRPFPPSSGVLRLFPALVLAAPLLPVRLVGGGGSAVVSLSASGSGTGSSGRCSPGRDAKSLCTSGVSVRQALAGCGAEWRVPSDHQG